MDLSIIVPCYNSGLYLEDAIESVRKSAHIADYRYEIIIINDGSTDAATQKLLFTLNDYPDCIVLHKDNGGPASARNYGLKEAKGRNLLFLDSDNRLRPQFIEKGISLLDTGTADIIHGRPCFFGASDAPRFVTGPFEINKILVQNYIDMCCMMRREVCIRLNGFDEEKKLIGFEDWDIYIRAHDAGFRFHFIDEELYDYRIVPGSLSQRHSEEEAQAARSYLQAKHARLVSQSLLWYHAMYQAYQLDRQRPLRSYIKYLYRKYTDRIQFL